MKKTLLALFLLLFGSQTYAQTITIVGTGVNGWPPTNGPEITLSTTDNVTYTISNLTITTGFVKFRQDFSWDINWGGSTFPNGQGTQNGPDIPTVAGTYDVTLNRVNGTYTFIGTAAFPSIGIWGPAVDSQNGYGGADVDMVTNDGITYTLSGFNFSSGNAYFRQDNATNFVWGSTAFPSGTAVQNGPSIPITGGEYFVTFNRNTGAYSFQFPSIGILGSALGGFGVEDTDLVTTDGFTYTLSNLQVITGEVKFRKDNSWATNWGSTAFPDGTGTQNGPNIPIPGGVYNVTFERTSGNYSFVNALSTQDFSLSSVKIFPNPAVSYWTVQSEQIIDKVELIDITGKIVQTLIPNQTHFIIDGSNLTSGIYYLKLTSSMNSMVQKIIKY